MSEQELDHSIVRIHEVGREDQVFGLVAHVRVRERQYLLLVEDGEERSIAQASVWRMIGSNANLHSGLLLDMEVKPVFVEDVIRQVREEAKARLGDPYGISRSLL